MCLSARTDGTRDAEVYEPLSCTADELGTGSRGDSGRMDDARHRMWWWGNAEKTPQGSAEKLPYLDNKFDLVTAVETVYFWPNLPDCLQEVRRVLKSGGKFAIMVEVVDSDSKWTSVVEGMTAYSPEELKKMLDDAGFINTEIHRMKPSNATILGVKP